MNLIKLNPWREREMFQDHFNSIFEGNLFPALFEGGTETAHWRPAVDIYDKDDRLVLRAELPGVDKEDIELDLKERVLTLKGERKNEMEVKKENYFRKEISYGSFQRAFTLPEGVNQDAIKADFKDGILTVEIPKAEEEKPKRISVH